MCQWGRTDLVNMELTDYLNEWNILNGLRYLSSMLFDRKFEGMPYDIIRMTKLFKWPDVFSEWVTKSFKRPDAFNGQMTKSFEQLMFLMSGWRSSSNGLMFLANGWPSHLNGWQTACKAIRHVVAWEVTTLNFLNWFVQDQYCTHIMSQLLITYFKIGSSTATIYINNTHAYIHVPNFICTP